MKYCPYTGRTRPLDPQVIELYPPRPRRHLRVRPAVLLLICAMLGNLAATPAPDGVQVVCFIVLLAIVAFVMRSEVR